MTHYKKTILLIVGIIYVLPIYTMSGNLVDPNNQKLLDPSFYRTLDNVDLLKNMLAHNANPNIKNSFENTTALILAATSHYSEYVSILLNAGADPNLQTQALWGPLHDAGHSPSLSVQLLLKAKADPNLEGRRGLRPLHSASHNHNHVNLKLLLSANANPNLEDRNGFTPLDDLINALTNNRGEIQCEGSEIVKSAQLLLQYGAHVELFKDVQCYPLKLLANKKSFPMARKMGRLLVWHSILLRYLTQLIPEPVIVTIIASDAAALCAEEPTIWTKKSLPNIPKKP